MTTIPTIAIYAHRFSDLQVRAIESIARNTEQSYNLLIVCEPGTAHENMNRVFDRCSTRYLIFADEDIEILQRNWLDLMLETLTEHDDVGIVGVREIKRPEQRAGFINYEWHGGNHLDVASWVPAYLMGFDMERCGDIRADEKIPGLFQMTDVDLCYSVRSRGLKVVVDNRIIVYHPLKMPEEIVKYRSPSIEEMKSWYEPQRQYMISKWKLEEITAEEPHF